MEDGVGVGKLDPFLFGEHFLHLSHGELFEAVVVVNVQESAANQVGAEVVDVLRGEDDIAVSGDMDERVVEDVGAAYIDGGILWVEIHVELGVAESYEVCEGSGVGIPVTATIIFKKGDLSLGVSGAAAESQQDDSEQATIYCGVCHSLSFQCSTRLFDL